MPLSKLERHLTKLPANITVKQMDSLESRLAALGRARRARPRCRRARCPRRRRCAACSAPCAGAAELIAMSAARLKRYRLTTAVSGEPVLQTAPVGVGEQRRDHQRDQHPAHQRPADPTCCGRRPETTRSPSANWPGVKPNSRTDTAPSTNQTTSDRGRQRSASPITDAERHRQARQARRR